MWSDRASAVVVYAAALGAVFVMSGCVVPPEGAPPPVWSFEPQTGIPYRALTESETRALGWESSSYTYAGVFRLPGLVERFDAQDVVRLEAVVAGQLLGPTLQLVSDGVRELPTPSGVLRERLRCFDEAPEAPEDQMRWTGCHVAGHMFLVSGPFGDEMATVGPLGDSAQQVPTLKPDDIGVRVYVATAHVPCLECVAPPTA